MTFELFVPQLDGSLNCAGRITGGFNCTCASEAMWLYRASQGRIKTTGGHVRDLTNDCSGGTNLVQMREVSDAYGISGGTLLMPGGFDSIMASVRAGRGAHLNISYSAFRGTRYDCFRGRFTGNHDIYLSRAGSVAGTMRVGDPGADGRYAGCPDGFQNIPLSLLRTAAARLHLGNGVDLAEEYGGGKAYAYLTPQDPVTSWQVSIQPRTGERYREFNWFELTSWDGGVTAVHLDRTGGFTAGCTGPHKTTFRGEAVMLVRILTGSRAGRYVRASWAEAT